ncbi:isocitrate lyase/phosphoenolpyruvate mutase family protein [Plantactinospora sp. GCM10030261]|uniref:isocitrate lyase/PEP mutase family protein n=1 Tax=Plantactinospora sp. GCM10030261 TaxID=3273420 RepID=UPI00362009D3
MASDSVGADRATALRALHRPGAPVVLPNAWDAGSARAVEAAGFPVVATSSAAMAESLGYADGEHAPVDEVMDAVARIVRVVSVPVTVDLESGYGLAPVELVERLVATGAVGCNLEDTDPRTGELREPSAQADFLAAVRSAAQRAGVELVLNARTDVYLRGGAEPTTLRAEAVRRGRAYLAAGADCAYPIAVGGAALDRTTLVELVREIGGPVNVLYRPDGLTLAELAETGVARVSFGPGIYRASQAHLSSTLATLR